MGSPAKVLRTADVRRLLQHIAYRRKADRGRVMVLLSFKAGLRACEIAGLDWSMVMRANGRIGDALHVSANIAKMGSARHVPLHPDLRAAIVQLHRGEGRPIVGPVCRSDRGGALTAKSVVNWFGALYAEVGMMGCSSHSGRRTFITQSARLLAKTGGSLRDIQELAGHRALSTTERYIEGDRVAQRRLIRLL
jgi:integrase/recombinase XerD